MSVRSCSIVIFLNFLNFLSPFRATEAILEAAAILPHGDVAVDPDFATGPIEEKLAAHAIAGGAALVGNWMGRAVNPDVLFLSSPHGIALPTHLAVYAGDTASGYATIGPDEPKSNQTPYNVTLAPILLDSHLANRMVSKGTREGHRVAGILGSPDHPLRMDLRWGEVIPLSLIPHRQPFHKDQTTLSTNRKRKLLKGNRLARKKGYRRRHLILSFPFRRYVESQAMVPELLRWGEFVRGFLDILPDKVGVVVSGDLSHTHRADGPYGYSNSSTPFDTAVGTWAADPCSEVGEKALLETARDFQPRALSCGFTGFVMLHGILCSRRGDKWLSNVAVNRNVTYFGMMAASFQREESNYP